MNGKRIKLGILVLMCLPGMLFAQKTERQEGDTTYYPSLIPEAKQGLLRNVSVIANMNFALRNEFYNGEYTQTRFRNEQFRLEIKGQVHEKVYFRFRDRYTRAQTSESLDNLSRSVDLAFLRFDISKKFSFSAGKMCADWGAWEFDYNPIDIYEYSDIIEYADNFLTGVGATYTANSKHQFTVQVLDTRTKSFGDLYGAQPNFQESQIPLAYVINWRGSLFDNKVKTIWSYSLFNEAEKVDSVIIPGQQPPSGDAYMNYIALGTELTLGKFVIAYDYKLSDEDLDRTTIVSETVPDSLYAFSLQKCTYTGHWVHLHYRISPKINVALFGMLDIAEWNNSDQDPLKTQSGDKIRTAYGFIPVVEYYPWSNLNLRFFANYVGRMYEYSDYAKSRFGAVDYDTGRFTIGFVSPLGIL